MRRYSQFHATPDRVAALPSVGSAPAGGDVTGAVTQTLGALTSVATGTVAMTGVLAVTLSALTLRATNVIGSPSSFLPTVPTMPAVPKIRLS